MGLKNGTGDPFDTLLPFMLLHRKNIDEEELLLDVDALPNFHSKQGREIWCIDISNDVALGALPHLSSSELFSQSKRCHRWN